MKAYGNAGLDDLKTTPWKWPIQAIMVPAESRMQFEETGEDVEA